MAQRVRTFLRYYAATDDSAVGRAALEYLKSLLRIAPVRVLSMSGGLSGPWEHYRAALATPIGPTFVNVVCCHPSRWAWDQGVDMPVLGPDRQIVGFERVRERIELYTARVRNVLAICTPVEQLTPSHLSAAAKYEARIAASGEIWTALMRVSNDMTAQSIIPVPVSITDHDVLRSVVMP